MLNVKLQYTSIFNTEMNRWRFRTKLLSCFMKEIFDTGITYIESLLKNTNCKCYDWNNRNVLVFPATQPVAFSAALANTIELPAGDIIKFDHIFIDTHGLYNPNVGIYTIPLTGIYEITATIFKAGGSGYNDAQAEVMVNDELLSRLYNYTPVDVSSRLHSSSSIIIRLTIGDTLYVKTATSVIYNSSGQASQFSVKYLGESPEHV